jgi:hypothetical protein
MYWVADPFSELLSLYSGYLIYFRERIINGFIVLYHSAELHVYFSHIQAFRGRSWLLLRLGLLCV